MDYCEREATFEWLRMRGGLCLRIQGTATIKETEGTIMSEMLATIA